MVTYADLKRRKVVKLLRWLERTGSIHVKEGGRHTTVEHIVSGDKHPIPTSHSTVNKHILKGFMKWLVAHKVCTKEEFEKRL